MLQNINTIIEKAVEYVGKNKENVAIIDNSSHAWSHYLSVLVFRRHLNQFCKVEEIP